MSVYVFLEDFNLSWLLYFIGHSNSDVAVYVLSCTPTKSSPTSDIYRQVWTDGVVKMCKKRRILLIERFLKFSGKVGP